MMQGIPESSASHIMTKKLPPTSSIDDICEEDTSPSTFTGPTPVKSVALTSQPHGSRDIHPIEDLDPEAEDNHTSDSPRDAPSPPPTSISTLPHEILISIFEYAIVIEDPTPNTPTLYRRLTHICCTCRLWRQSAFNAGHLWRHIDLTTFMTTAYMIERSRPYPLVIDIDAPYPGDSMDCKPMWESVLNIRALCHSYKTRVCSLSISGSNRHINELLNIVNSTPFNSLSSLSISCHEASSYSPLYNLFYALSRATPLLRTITFSRCLFNSANLKSSVLGQLEQLHVHRSSFDLSILRNLTCLRSLCLIDPDINNTNEGSGSLPDHGQFHLPALRSLKMEAPTDSCIQVLGAIASLQDVEVVISISQYWIVGPCTQLLRNCGLLDYQTPHPNPSTPSLPNSYRSLTTLSISNTGSAYTLAGWTNSHNDALYPTTSSKPTIALTCPFLQPQSRPCFSASDYAEAILTQIHILTLKCLVLKDMLSVRESIWRKIFDKMGSVEHLVLDGVFTIQCIEALRPLREGGSNPEEAPEMPMPRLKALTLRNVAAHFESDDDDAPPSLSPSHTPEQLVAEALSPDAFDPESTNPLHASLLMACIRDRARAGLPIARLRLVDCRGLRPSDVEKLEGMVWL